MDNEKEIVTVENEFPSNSNGDNVTPLENNDVTSPPQLKQINPGDAVVKKKTFINKFMDVAGDILKYTLDDVLVPTFKRTASEIIRTASDRAIWGDSAPLRSRGSYWDDDYYPSTRYDSYYTRGSSRPTRRDSFPVYSYDRRTRSGLPRITYKYDSVARDFLDNIRDLLEYRQRISVIEVYDQSRIPGIMEEIDYTWDRYGWENSPNRDLRGAEVVKIKEGEYEVVLPKPVIIER